MSSRKNWEIKNNHEAKIIQLFDMLMTQSIGIFHFWQFFRFVSFGGSFGDASNHFFIHTLNKSNPALNALRHTKRFFYMNRQTNGLRSSS